MEYVVPLIIVLVIVIVVVVASRLVGRRKQSVRAPVGDGRTQSHPPVEEAGTKGQGEITREAAEEASARLAPESHRLVYSLIAQHQVLNAVKEYRKATHLGLGDAAAAVAALAEFPQPTPEPQVPGANTPLTVEGIINPAPANPAANPAPANPAPTSGYRYRAIVSQGEEIREVASTRLNEEIFGRIRRLALAGNYDGAARLLREHADIGETEAHEFVAMITPDE